MESLVKGTIDYFREDFGKNITKMISDFLTEEGYTIFNNEKAYIELMSTLNKT